jgi:hypothetical protein
MTAVETARRVLVWSMQPTAHPPTGDLRELEALRAPAPELAFLAAHAAALAAARLSLTSPPLNDPRPPGPYVIWLAAAVGACTGRTAVELTSQTAELVRCVPPHTCAWDLVARHAVVGPAVTAIGGSMGEQLLLASPLTAILLLPPRGAEDTSLALLEQWLEHADARRLLVHLFCRADAPAPMLSWRGRLLEALRLEERHRPFVLDVYEAAVALYGREWLERIGKARAVLMDRQPSKHQLNEVLSVARWWQPFRALHRAYLQQVRSRRYLHFQVYLAGVSLAQDVARLEGSSGW